MQKLVIRKPFMAVEPCEIEFDRFLLLIGEQASGKSTIAKLIYFFQSLRDDLIELSLDDEQKNDLRTTFITEISEKFLDWFGRLRIKNVEIDFHYDKDKFVKIHTDSKLKLKVELSPNLLSEETLQDKTNLKNELKEKQKGFWYQLTSLFGSKGTEKIVDLINKEFGIHQKDKLYIVAGRSTTVSYSELFEKEFFASVKININDKSKTTGIVDDFIMLDFIKRVIAIKKAIKTKNAIIELANIYSDEEIIEKPRDSMYFLEPEEELEVVGKVVKAKTLKILKADYFVKGEDEILRSQKNQEEIFLSQSSSGQQESIRILQDLVLVISDKTPVLRVVEEPEAHLYPTAQKDIIDLFALMLNQNEHNKLIITTHSPYILACVNILLFAHYVEKQNPAQKNEVSDSVNPAFWLDSNMFSAYSLGQEEAYCVNIKDPETGLIDQTYLDLISEQLGLQYHKLYELLA